MRRINICEERGSGIDKVINAVELFQLPAPEFRVTNNHTQVTLFAYKKLADMDKADRVQACYQHACLRHVKQGNVVLAMRDMVNSSSALAKYPILVVFCSLLEKNPEK